MIKYEWKSEIKMQWNIVIITILQLFTNPILDNPWEVDMPFNK